MLPSPATSKLSGTTLDIDIDWLDRTYQIKALQTRLEKCIPFMDFEVAYLYAASLYCSKAGGGLPRVLYPQLQLYNYVCRHGG